MDQKIMTRREEAVETCRKDGRDERVLQANRKPSRFLISGFPLCFNYTKE